jgi:hypothetical protein
LLNPCGLSIEEVTYQGDHFIGFVLQGEVAGVEEMKFHVSKVTLIWMRAIGGEDLVVLAPHDQRRRPVLAKISLNRGIERQVGAVLGLDRIPELFRSLLIRVAGPAPAVGAGARARVGWGYEYES